MVSHLGLGSNVVCTDGQLHISCFTVAQFTTQTAQIVHNHTIKILEFNCVTVSLKSTTAATAESES